MRKENILKRIGDVLSSLEVELGYVFGSFLDSDRFEDIDVAVLTSKNFTPYERFKFSMRAASKLENEVEPRLEFDVKVLNASPIGFQYEVIVTGKLVFFRDELKRIRYEENVLGDFLDYAETSRWLDERFLVKV